MNRKKGTFSILLTLTIIFIFMICFFYSYIIPKIDDAVKEKIDQCAIDATAVINNTLIGHQKNNKISDTLIPDISKRVYSSEISGILKTFSDREKNLVNKINIYIKTFALVIIFIMCCTLYGINKSITGDISYPISMSVLTLLIFGMFQIFFYKFAMAYKYQGSFGNEEIIDIALNNISLCS